MVQGKMKAFDNDLKADKDKGFRVDKIVEQIVHYINVSDLNGFKDYWSHLDTLVFSKLEIHVQPAVRKLEYSLYKLYLVTAAQSTGGARNERITDFLSKMLPELQGQNEWRDWFMLPFIQKPEENPSFSLYFTRAWQDSVLVSLHNLLATVFQCMPQPTLTSYESDAAMVKRLQDKLAAVSGKSQPQQTEKTSPIGHQSRLSQYSERLSGPLPLVDDFCAVPSEQLESGVREAKGLRGLLRQMGGSPVMGRKASTCLNMAHAFYSDAAKRSERRNRKWYMDNLLNVLQAAKENQVREIDASIVLAEELMRVLNEPLSPPPVVPLRNVVPTKIDAVMYPIEENVLDILRKSTEKGSATRYLKERYKKSPEEKFLYRVATSWDYGWQQKQAKVKARDVNFGRSFILKHTFYRKNNLTPDPPHYAQPSGGQTSICSEYSCNFS
ncbi:hypothetical protein HW555_001904 [Spodoptera exigua]|uniref:Uncharacterized protein n=2 Tax=Spodoptera exigua TaxID=7107 RepID=A0A835L7G6_SPOEX|nr:hypothetical protein HW555_001904 [Spodoptera exigua]